MPYQREENFCFDLLEINDLLTRRNEEHPFLFIYEKDQTLLLSHKAIETF
jgi:hypothetical protein